MDRWNKGKLPGTGRKTASITIRCTENFEKRARVKAGQMGESLSEFVSECIEAGMKRNTRHGKSRARALVEMQEEMNRIIAGLGDGQDKVKTQLLDFMEGTVRLWED